MFFDHHRELVRAYHEEERRRRCYEMLGRLVVWAAGVCAITVLVKSFMKKEEEKKEEAKAKKA